MTTIVTVRHVHGENKFEDGVNCGDSALNAVLFDFNPSSKAEVVMIKAMCAGVIQMMRDHQTKDGTTDAQKRVAAYAITQMELAQMAAVKALFAK